MTVGIVRETFPGEKRVALVPANVPQFQKLGLEILLETGAGSSAGYPDSVYESRGVKITRNRANVFSSADIILIVRGLGANPEAGKSDLELMKKGQVLVGSFEPLSEPESIKTLAARGVTVFSMELMPRITRAQSMDTMSSMATVAGYRAVLLAAEALPRMFPMMMTAAGTIAPAHVFVVGAGVAGLQAIASAKRMGAVVQAYDVRPVVKEQVESLGGKFVELDLDTGDAETKGGYAKEMGEEFLRKQREMMTRVVAGNDVVITTAAVPGKRAPILVTADMVRGMKPGSVVVDLAAERGGNCELTKAGETVIENDVKILGPVNMPADVPYHASQMYSKNLTNFMSLLVKEGKLLLDSDDEIIRATMIARDGEIISHENK
ncbi:MAG: Re/Si-specific NAD(P)(+) transhydrogenase subunit alpha [Candidatus Zixiibacteriota bacterium]|nr:MAG: Re/Si-specific NAD(P)(+) transhydrogenase subunit alpha [candidate division Zixibacteria bacterium]